jgi:hypothetical protein
MQKNHNVCCVLFYDNTRYNELSKLAYNSFIKFHKDEVDVYLITPENIESYPITTYVDFPNVNGIKKYIRGYEIMVTKGYNKVIILDVDTITCSRLDEFLDDDTDVLATLNYPCQESTEYWVTPLYTLETEDGDILYDHANLNAGVICFSNPNALKKVIDLSINHLTHFAEQGGLNELAWSDGSYEVKIVDGPYIASPVIYNCRAKGVFGTEMIKKGVLAKHGSLDGLPSPLKYYYIDNKKLFNIDNKQIKCFHFVEGLGFRSEEGFKEVMDDFKYYWFNKETIQFFKEECGGAEFFD